MTKSVAYEDIDKVFVSSNSLEEKFAKYYATFCQATLEQHHGLKDDLRSSVAVFIKAALEDFPKFVKEHEETK